MDLSQQIHFLVICVIKISMLYFLCIMISCLLYTSYTSEVPKEQQISAIKTLEKKYKGDIKRWADDIYRKSILVDETRLDNFLQNPKLKTLENDLGFQITLNTLSSLREIWQEMSRAEAKQKEGYRKYIAGLREMMPEKAFYPDANSTMRMTYGDVYKRQVFTLNGDVVTGFDPVEAGEYTLAVGIFNSLATASCTSLGR